MTLVNSNVHEREYPVPAAELGALLDTMGGAGDRVWPSEYWPPLVADLPLRPGSAAGHGPIHYSVLEYQPGRRLRCGFAESMPMSGEHELTVLDGSTPDSSVLRHVLLTERNAFGRFVFPWTVERLHDALLEDLLDRVGVELGHPPRRPARWSPWVRLLRATMSGRELTGRRDPSVPR